MKVNEVWILKLRNACRDLIRGYSDEDVKRVKAKIIGPFKPGGIIILTNKEFKAYIKKKIYET